MTLLLVAVSQWITSCHKNCITTRVITFWRIHITSFTTSVSTMHLLIEIMFILKAKKYHLKKTYNKQNFTLVCISYDIYETRRRLVRSISYEITTRIRSSIYPFYWILSIKGQLFKRFFSITVSFYIL